MTFSISAPRPEGIFKGHHGGSGKRIFTNLANLVSLEQFHQKPMGVNIPTGL